ncbi:MAG: 3-deoxy-D-manno-octulosonic acid transferase [Bacteroidaceae bacterium]|nr:3-deoxy-D-manno-octulosonic acid transferase [Bacteroidaceae bacterium]
MYTLVIYLYMCAVGIAAIFNKRARKLAVGHRKAFFQLKHQVQKDARYLWFHAASLGEFEQGRPLMERLRREHPEYKILLTFFSPSGYEVRKDWEGADVICYLPLDTPAHVRLFFHFVKPEALFLIKYEFWQNYLKGCQRLHIPVYSVSSIFRPGQIFFRWYGRGYARVLTRVTHFFVQNQQSADLLASLGISGNVTVAGDTRFDRVLDIRASARPLPLVEKFAAGHVVFVAGSSWPPDEALFIPWFLERSNPVPPATSTPPAARDQVSYSATVSPNPTAASPRLIIAPHLIGEDHLRDIESRLAGLRVLRYTAATEENVADADVLIINCFGLLSSIYRYGQLAMVGGGFGAGIHNVPEAAVYGIPVLIGPNNQNFREARHLLDAGACFEVHDAADFNRIADHLLSDTEAYTRSAEAARHYIADNAGATDTIYQTIFPA